MPRACVAAARAIQGRRIMGSAVPPPSREEILAFLAANDLQYQRVELPHGLATPGADRSETARLVFPEDLAGQSVLDIGCYLGYFCHEAKRRNAGRVVGADLDEERLRQARELARFAGHEIEFRRFDLDREELAEEFDVVTMLNVIHHTKDPVRVLETISRRVRRRLVLEVPGPSDPAMRAYLGRRFDLRRRRIRDLERLPLIAVGRGNAMDGLQEQGFFFTEAAIRNILLEQRRLFSRVDIVPSPKRGRFVAVAHRRRIGDLIVVAGATGVGKSRFAEAILSPGGSGLRRRLGIPDAPAARLVEGRTLRKLEEPEVGTLVFHYDMLRPLRGGAGARSFDRDEALELLDCSARVHVLTLFCPPPTLVQRLEQRCRELSGARPPKPLLSRLARRLRGRPIERPNLALASNEQALALYRRPGEVRRLYEEWAGFLRRHGQETLFVDSSGEECRVLGAAELPRVLDLL